MSVISGTETQVNTYTTSQQDLPQITLTDGGWVVTWMSYGQDGDAYGVYQQRYDAVGTPRGGETLVNTTTLGVQINPQIAALGDGGWVVVWQSFNADEDNYDLFSQAFNADGTPQGSETAINAPTADDVGSQQVVALDDGGWVVTWYSGSTSSDDFSFHQQSYHADGSIRSADAQVNSHPLSYLDGTSDFHQTIALADGGWVVISSYKDPAVSTFSLVQQAYDADGSARGAETQVATGYDQDLQIASLADGGWIATWAGSGDADFNGIYQQRYDSDGNAIDDKTLVNTSASFYQSNTSVAALPGGGWVVTWRSSGQGGDLGGIYQQAYLADGALLGTETMVNVSTASDQYDPTVTALVDGSWVVTWLSDDDGDGTGVFQQAFNPDGSLQGTEVRINDYTTGNQQNVQVTALPDGGWVVTWMSPGQDGDSSGVYQRVFHIDDHPPATIEGITDQTASEDAAFTFQIPADLFSDFEGDAFTYSALVNSTDLPDWLHFNEVTRTFTGTPANGDVGPLTVTVIVSSNDGAHTSNTFIINVTNTNDAPQPGGAIWPASAIEDSPYSFTFAANHFFDVDVGDTLTYSATSADDSALPDWLHFDPTTRTFSGTPLNGDVGSLAVKVIASDGSLSASMTFEIAVENTNDAPVTIPFTPPTIMEDMPFSFSIAGAFTDPDLGDVLSYASFDYPPWLTFDPSTGTISGTLDNDYVGIVSLTIGASDGGRLTVDKTFNFTVENTNDAPTPFGSLDEQDVFEDREYNFTFDADIFADQDIGDTLTYSATLEDGSDLPDWLDFDPSARTFSGTPDNGDVGTLSIKITATDGTLGASQTFSLWVRNSNDAPVVSHAIGNQVVYEDSPFTLALQPGTFVDVDLGDTLTYSATMEDGNNLPEWLVFNASTGTFTGTPSNSDVGTFTVRVTASDDDFDADDGRVTTSFTITVNNVNDAPTGLDKSVTTLEDTAYTFSAADFGYADIENNGFKEIIVAALPGSGELKLGGVLVEAGDHIAMADLAMLTWLADKDAYGDGLDAFSFQVVDDGQTAHGGSDTDATPKVITFDVDEVTDVYTGDKGVDRFTGTTAHDVFNGKGGRDTLTGDLGSDTFVFGKKYGRDTITDFEANGVDHDIVDLSKLKGFDNFKDVRAALEKHGHDVWLDAGKDVLVFEDVNIKHLGKGDFLF